jgi:hypothetical protein
MSHPTSITPAIFEKILAFLAPLFLGAGTSDIATAREAASAILASYGARTDRELRFAALSIAFGFGALESLSRASDPALALNQVLRLRGNANALNRAAQQNETRLENLRKQPPEIEDAAAAAATPNPPTDALPASSATADLLAFARSKLKSMMSVTAPAARSTPAPVVPLSRQQRRAEERKAEKIRLRQLEEAKRAQRAAQRTAPAKEPMRQSA